MTNVLFQGHWPFGHSSLHDSRVRGLFYHWICCVIKVIVTSMHMTKQAMVPLINSMPLVTVIKITIFRAWPCWDSFYNVSLVKKFLYNLFLLSRLNPRPSLLEDVHWDPGNLSKFSWCFVSFKRKLWELSYLCCKAVFSFSRSLILVCKFSKIFISSHFPFLGTCIAFEGPWLQFCYLSHILNTLIDLEWDTLLWK